jgi:single-strand DNA-binding protein
MNSLNSILIEGTLTKDPLYEKATSANAAVCVFTIASNRYFKEKDSVKEEVSCFEIEARSKLAEECCRQGHKGRDARIVGRLEQKRWTDGQGNKQSKIIIRAEHVEFKKEDTL